ncbi:hypothetical protein [Intestinibacter sp.]|uniref:hypothetical protein n=1 Tax=Intestinibacter sp. TaxID=1965304 RepID=UPI002A919F8F|nr:hypothetical protein [Intestinibacter sp.]MDY5211771.1 hypothetical protein [Intestinibacter sp.]
MEVYESIINRINSMLDEVENNIILNRRSKELINNDLNNIINISIDTKDFFKSIYYEEKQEIVLEEITQEDANIIFSKLTECIARGAFLKSIIYMKDYTQSY